MATVHIERPAYFEPTHAELYQATLDADKRGKVRAASVSRPVSHVQIMKQGDVQLSSLARAYIEQAKLALSCEELKDYYETSYWDSGVNAVAGKAGQLKEGVKNVGHSVLLNGAEYAPTALGTGYLRDNMMVLNHKQAALHIRNGGEIQNRKTGELETEFEHWEQHLNEVPDDLQSRLDAARAYLLQPGTDVEGRVAGALAHAQYVINAYEKKGSTSPEGYMMKAAAHELAFKHYVNDNSVPRETVRAHTKAALIAYKRAATAYTNRKNFYEKKIENTSFFSFVLKSSLNSALKDVKEQIDMMRLLRREFATKVLASSKELPSSVIQLCLPPLVHDVKTKALQDLAKAYERENNYEKSRETLSVIQRRVGSHSAQSSADLRRVKSAMKDEKKFINSAKLFNAKLNEIEGLFSQLTEGTNPVWAKIQQLYREVKQLRATLVRLSDNLPHLELPDLYRQEIVLARAFKKAGQIQAYIKCRQSLIQGRGLGQLTISQKQLTEQFTQMCFDMQKEKYDSVWKHLFKFIDDAIKSGHIDVFNDKIVTLYGIVSKNRQIANDFSVQKKIKKANDLRDEAFKLKDQSPNEVGAAQVFMLRRASRKFEEAIKMESAVVKAYNEKGVKPRDLLNRLRQEKSQVDQLIQAARFYV